jgi:hypothetical protein
VTAIPCSLGRSHRRRRIYPPSRAILARATIDALVDRAPDGLTDAIRALVAQLGDNDQAMIWLEKAYEARFNPSILLRPAWDPLRSDARFKDLRRRIGLPQ